MRDAAFEIIASGLPLGRFRSMHTADPDEVERNLHHRGVTSARLLNPPAKGFRYASNGLLLNRLSLVASLSRGFTVWTPGGSGSIIVLHDRSQPAGAMQWDGGEPLLLDRGGAISDAGGPGQLRKADMIPCLTLGIPGDATRQRLEALLGRHVRAAPRIDLVFDTSCEPGAGFARCIRFLVEEIDRNPGLIDSPVALTSWEDLMIAQLLACFPHEHAEELARPGPDAAPWQVRRAEAWLAANAAEPVTMGELAAAVGISLRTLQHAFQRSRGYSPRTFLRLCRLDLARARLLGAVSGTTVTEVALDCGFAHLSAFARDYRLRFGESPSATLRRG